MLYKPSHYATSKIISFPNRKNGKFMNLVSAHGKVYEMKTFITNRMLSLCSCRKLVYDIIPKYQKCSANHHIMQLQKLQVFQTEIMGSSRTLFQLM